VAWVALAGAGLLLALAAAFGRFRTRRFAHGVSWSLFPFVGGMVLVVQGVERMGLTTAAARWMLELSAGSSLVGVVVVTFGVGLGANLVNNVPVALIAASALGSLPPDA